MRINAPADDGGEAVARRQQLHSSLLEDGWHPNASNSVLHPIVERPTSVGSRPSSKAADSANIEKIEIGVGKKDCFDKPLIFKLLLGWVSIVLALTTIALMLANRDTTTVSDHPGTRKANVSQANATKRIAIDGGFVCDADG